MKTKTKDLLIKIEAIFTEKLKTKTGWGRNEVIAAYKESVNEAVLDIIDTAE